jgi:hypothetical protein
MNNTDRTTNLAPVLTRRAYRARVRKLEAQVPLLLLAGDFDAVRAVRAEVDALNAR